MVLHLRALTLVALLVLLEGMPLAGTAIGPVRAGRPAPVYTVVDLGTLPGGAESTAMAINASGQVVGAADTPLSGGRLQHEDAFRTSAQGTLSSRSADLGTLGDLSRYADNAATAINDRGQVAGSTGGPSSNVHVPVALRMVLRAFRLGASESLAVQGANLGVLPGYDNSMATGIDASGRVVGFAYTGPLGGTHRSRAFRLAPAGTLAGHGADLGGLGGTVSAALAVNARGQAAGIATTRDGLLHAFRTMPGGVITAAADLGEIDPTCTNEETPMAMNNYGQIAGTTSFARNGGGCRAFRTSPTGSPSAPDAYLGDLPGYPLSEARSINDRGQVVGDAYDEAHTVYRAFLYEYPATPHMRDLNSLIPTQSGVTLIEADGINDAGQIAATGQIHGHLHAFRLTPTVPSR